MFVLIKQREAYRSKINGLISRVTDDQFFCEVFWPITFLNADRKIKLENAIQKYINEKSEFEEGDYLVRWEKVRFNITKDHFEKFDTYEIRAKKMMNKYGKYIGE